jgi:cytoskeletal protein RodZ
LKKILEQLDENFWDSFDPEFYMELLRVIFEVKHLSNETVLESTRVGIILRTFEKRSWMTSIQLNGTNYGTV